MSEFRDVVLDVDAGSRSPTSIGPERCSDRAGAAGRSRPGADTAGIPRKRIVPEADLPRFLDRFVTSLLGRSGLHRARCARHRRIAAAFVGLEP